MEVHHACGGEIRVSKEPTFMDHEERGWDYLAKCDKCSRQIFGYTMVHAIQRLQDDDDCC